jgi:hypothetical protein
VLNKSQMPMFMSAHPRDARHPANVSPMKQQFQTRTNAVSRGQNHLDYRAFPETEARS